MLKQKNPSLRRSLLVNGMIPSLVILLLGSLLFWQVLRVRDEASLVAHTISVRRQAYHVYSKLAGTESDLRGLLITGDVSFMRSHEQLNLLIEEELEDLERLVHDNPAQIREIQAVERMWPRWEENADREIRAWKAGDLQFSKYVLGPHGAPLMKQMQERLGAFIEREGALLEKRQAALWRTSLLSGLIGAIALALAIGFFVLFSFRQFRLLDRFYRGNIQALELQTTQLKDLTASLEDAKATLEARVAERTRALEKANEALSRLAALDGLTGIPNRRSFDDFLQREWGLATRNATRLSCIMIDIDHFKAYNDTYGHQAGDECLIQVAKALQACVTRPGDLVARYGGEEFGIILPATDAAGARVIAERMRLHVEQLGIPHVGSSVADCVTLSLGSATLVDSETSPEDLLQAADRALYQAKHQGRNQVATSQAAAVETV
jgi:diguanylate cyclase (GGDEF)-like protein